MRSSGSCRSVSARSGTLLVIATLAPLRRSTTSIGRSGRMLDVGGFEARPAHARVERSAIEKDDAVAHCGAQATRRRVALPIVGGGRHAAAGGNFHAAVDHGHLRTGQRRHEHELVAIAQMADAEQTAGHSGEARAEREVIALEGTRNDVRSIDALRAP